MTKSTYAGWHQALLEYVQSVGINARQLHREAGVHLNVAVQERVSQDDMTRLWHAACQLSGDPLVGLKTGKHLRPTVLGNITWAMMSCSDVAASVELLLNYQHFLADALDFKWIEHNEYVELVTNNIGDNVPASSLSVDAVIMAFISFFKWLTKDFIQFSRVHFTRAELSFPDAYQSYLPCKIRLNQSHNSIWLHRSELAIALSTADATMHSVHRAQLDRQAKLRLLGDFRGIVATLIRQNMHRGRCSSQFIAQSLHMSKSTLQRKLKEEQISVKLLVNEVVIQTAMSLLRNTSLPLTHIADQLGFSSVNSFSRTFKRLTGQSPGGVRKAARE